MINYLFACDLDNTLIHSYKHKTDDDVCVEIYNEREQSFILSKAAKLLKEVMRKVNFVPVTTRSIEQYRRIKWCDIKPEYAVTSNGAILLHNDNIDVEWQCYFFDIINPYKSELQRQYDKFAQNKIFSNCRIVDDSFLFLKCTDNADKIANDIGKDTSLVVEHTGQKIYLFPPNLNKGEALQRLKIKFEPIKTLAAGDSVIDKPMLNLADTAYTIVTLSDTLLMLKNALNIIKGDDHERIFSTNENKLANDRR